MGTLIQLAIYAAIAGALIFGVHRAWTGFKDSIGAPYAQAQLEKDAPVLKKAQDDATQALADRDTARGNEASCKAASEVLTKAAQAQKAASDRAQAAAAQAQREASKIAKDAAPRIADLQAKARAKETQALKCEDELKITADELRATAKERLKARGK